MTVATCVCCSITSDSQTRYGSRVRCQGRSCRPLLACQATSRAAKARPPLRADTPPDEAEFLGTDQHRFAGGFRARGGAGRLQFGAAAQRPCPLQMELQCRDLLLHRSQRIAEFADAALERILGIADLLHGLG